MRNKDKAKIGTMPPTGREIRLLRLTGGKPPRREWITVRLGERRDKLDYNPNFCTARNRAGEQCGRPPVRGSRVCSNHGVAPPKRVRAGRRLSPEAAAQLQQHNRMARMPEKAFRDLARRFRYLAEREKFYLEHPDLLGLEANAARLQALSDWLMTGEVEIGWKALVDKQAALTMAKARALQAKAAIEARAMVPARVVKDWLNGVAELFRRYVPQDRIAALYRDLDALGISAVEDPEPARGNGAGGDGLG